MPIIRNTKIQTIKNKILNSKKFSLNDFKLEFPDEGKIWVNITFRTLSQYSFIIEENIVNDGGFDFHLTISNQKKKTVIQTIQRPGINKNKEIFTHSDIDECIDAITPWLKNLDEDLQNMMELNIEDISDIADFEETLNKRFTNENERFSNEEQEKLRVQLDKLKERIEKLEQNDDSRKSLDIIEQSKNELLTYPKKSWWMKLYNRVKDANSILKITNDIQDNIMSLLENFNT